MRTLPTARDCMSAWFATLRPAMDVFDAMEILESKHAAGAPVLDKDGNLLGILTEKDCLRVLSNGTCEGIASGSVADYMSEPKAVLTVDMDIFTVAEKFLATNFAVLPVLENGKPVGRISRQDMLHMIRKLQREMVQEKQKEEHDPYTRTSPRAVTDIQRLAAATAPKNFAAVMSGRIRT